MLFIPKALAPLANLAGTSGSYTFSCVRVRRLAGDPERAQTCYRVEACDGRVLAIARGPSLPGPLDRAELPQPGSVALEALVPAAEFGKALRSLPKQRQLAVQMGGGEVLLASGSGDTFVRVPCRPGEGRWPDTDAVLPGRPALVSFCVNPLLLADVLRAAAAVSQTADGECRVEVLFFGQGQPVGVITKGKGGLTLDALVMVLTPAASPR